MSIIKRLFCVKMLRKLFYLLIPGMFLVASGCFTVKYSFSGASIHPDIKTASVQYFQNRAPIVNPQLSQEITDMLKDKIESQTSLIIVNGVGDVNFEGVITGYSASPASIGSNDQAAQNRFTITISVTFSNPIDPDTEYESSFSRYTDYPSTQSFETAQQSYSEEIIELLVDDIFNKAFVNW